jgi:hypothetical protein
MTLDTALDWLQKTALAITIRDSLFLFPLLESTHVIGLAIVVGTVIIIDLRLLGVATTYRPFSRLGADTLPWTLAGFAVAAVTGALMFITNAGVYFHNVWFRAKAVMLGLAALNAIVFELTARRRIVEWDLKPSAPPLARTAAMVSLLIWLGIVVAGRMIGFTATRATAAAPTPAEQPNFEELLGLPPAQ